MKYPQERSAQWANNPEPSETAMDPQTVLDANIDGQAWLYNVQRESTEWLTYRGQTMEVES